MELQQAVSRFKEIQRKMAAYNHAMGLLYYDSVTTAPSDSSQTLGQTLEVLSEESYRLSVNEELKEILRQLVEEKDSLDAQTRREAEKMYEEQQKLARIPMEEYVAFQVEVNEAQHVWHQAKEKSDYALFAPHLEKLIAFRKKQARYYQPEAENLYDVLLNEYEKGLTTAALDDYFARLRASVAPLVQRIVRQEKPPRTDFLQRVWPVEQQRRLSDWLMQLLTIDRSHCAIGETEHPFTIEFSKKDVRITTHYYENDVLSSLYSVVHEGGHALYELHLDDALIGSSLAHGTSMGVHESQSRFFENMIGRSQAFCHVLYPKLKELFPQQMADVSEEELYRAANLAQPSLIRTEADELTYSLHIMVRYELGKRIFADELTVDQLPAEWNRLYREYLGIEVPDDAHGILQDSHWSGGDFGYFPSYSIGSAYAAQIYAAMCRELDVPVLVQRGELAPVVDWLTQRIYRYGSQIDPPQVLLNCCGAGFDPQYYIDYLTKKFTLLYQL